jgi:hypothetical protein
MFQRRVRLLRRALLLRPALLRRRALLRRLARPRRLALLRLLAPHLALVAAAVAPASPVPAMAPAPAMFLPLVPLITRRLLVAELVIPPQSMVAEPAVVPRVVLRVVALAVVPLADLAACMARRWVVMVTLPTASTPARAAMAEWLIAVPAEA